MELIIVVIVLLVVLLALRRLFAYEVRRESDGKVVACFDTFEECRAWMTKHAEDGPYYIVQ